MIVGAYFYDSSQLDEGAAFVFLGGPSGIANGNPATAHAQLESNQLGAALGETVAGAGDVNGDGFADVIVSAHLYDSGQIDEGAAFVFEGGGVDGRPVLPRQALPGGTPVVQPWGSVPNAFQISLQASHPEGRGLVKLESEWCPTGVPFDDPSCGRQIAPAWTAVSTNLVSLAQNVSGLSPDTLYRWRARVLHAPSSSTQPGVFSTPNPAHGPWRRHQAQAFEADVRALPEPGIGVALACGIFGLAMRTRSRDRRPRTSAGCRSDE